jgi:MbtH protein
MLAGRQAHPSEGAAMTVAGEDVDQRVYRVVCNDEEQYSIWPADRELPPGWHAEGTTGSRTECLDHIGRVWTDMRPASLRRRMDRTEQVTGAV